MLFAARLTSVSVLLGGLVIGSCATAETASNTMWSKFETTRQDLRALHQQFEVMRRVKSAYAEQSSRYQVIVDFSQGKWREQAECQKETTPGLR